MQRKTISFYTRRSGVAVPDVPPESRREALALRLLPLVSLLNAAQEPPRRFHAFGIGPPRTGTHSLAAMFEGTYRAVHEPLARRTVQLLLRWKQGRYSDASIRRIFQRRDRRFGLELEAAHYLHHLAPVLAEAYPEARFILTLRDPRRWLASEVNWNRTHARAHYEHPFGDFWGALETYRYGRYGLQFQQEDQALQRHQGVFPLEAYLRYWHDHHDLVLKSIPQERLLVIRTEALAASAPALAAFLGISERTLDVARSHASRTPQKLVQVFDEVDPAYVDDLVERYCAPILARLSRQASPAFP